MKNSKEMLSQYKLRVYLLTVVIVVLAYLGAWFDYCRFTGWWVGLTAALYAILFIAVVILWIHNIAEMIYWGE